MIAYLRRMSVRLRNPQWHGWAGGIGLFFLLAAVVNLLSFRLVLCVLCLTAAIGWLHADRNDPTGLLVRLFRR